MWLTGKMRRVARDVGAFAAIQARIGLSQRMRSDGTAREGPDPISDPDHLEPGMGGSPNINIETFEPTTDMLVCIWDDSIIDAPAPQVRLETDPDHNGWLRIRLGADIVAKVHGRTALSSADLAVIPLSSARALGLAPPDGAFLQ